MRATANTSRSLKRAKWTASTALILVIVTIGPVFATESHPAPGGIALVPRDQLSP